MEKEFVLSTQLTLFFSKTIDRPDQLVPELGKKLSDVFDQIPTILPPIQSSNLNIPIVQMGSKDGALVCNISQTRLNIFVNSVGYQNYCDLKEKLLNLTRKISESFQGNIKRVGFVTNFFIEEKESEKVIAELVNAGFKSAVGSLTPHQANIIYSFVDTIGSFNINNYTAIQKISARHDEESLDGVNIIRDFNTIPTDDHKGVLTPDKLEAFIGAAEGKFNLEEIKRVLWPKRGIQ